MRMSVDDAVRDLRVTGEPYVKATVVWSRPPSSGVPGDAAIIRLDGTLHGWIGGACAEPVIIGEAQDVLAAGKPRVVFLGPAEEAGRPDAYVVPMSCASEGALEIFMEPVIPNPHIVIVGRSPAVATLARLLEVMDWGVTIVDEESKGADTLAGLNVVANLADIEPAAPTAVIVATQGHHDEPALEWAIGTKASYIGLVASPRRAATVREYLRSIPLTDEDVARVRAPTGIDLGPLEHEEIAVSILAGLVAEKSAGTLGAGSSVEMAAAPQTAIDPVCGMNVEISTARFTHEHEGETIYFCCPGCRVAFIADPDAYAST